MINLCRGGARTYDICGGLTVLVLYLLVNLTDRQIEYVIDMIDVCVLVSTYLTYQEIYIAPQNAERKLSSVGQSMHNEYKHDVCM